MTINTDVRRVLILRKFKDWWDFLKIHKQIETKKLYVYLREKGELVSEDAVYKTLYSMEQDGLVYRIKKKWQISEEGLKKLPELEFELKEYFENRNKDIEKSKQMMGA